MTLEAIKYAKGKLQILDQLLLPSETHYIDINNVEDGWTAIRSMQVRGAPGIAIVGCLSLVAEIYNNIYDSKDALFEEIKKKFLYLITSRPTAVNLLKETNKFLDLTNKLKNDNTVSPADMKNCLIGAIENLLVQDISDNKAIGKSGAETILTLPGEKYKILTHCNTGSLATSGYGTALGVIRRLHELGKLELVYCTETRPYMQGSRLTAYELVYEKIPSTLVCDSAVAALFQNTNITAVLVGADRVAANGDTANKIGTYQIAVLAKHHNISFYVCAPVSSIDFNTKTGNDIPIEERSSTEITDIKNIRIAAPGISCWNPAFDITPANLITGIITEVGCFLPVRLEQEILHLKKNNTNCSV
uniref:Methylthioribose-1-phosphate isomerase n=1 Tax=Triatoma dimidiata TaxID=72491 RepID=A0A0V0G7N2_TRIDM